MKTRINIIDRKTHTIDVTARQIFSATELLREKRVSVHLPAELVDECQDELRGLYRKIYACTLETEGGGFISRQSSKIKTSTPIK